MQALPAWQQARLCWQCNQTEEHLLTPKASICKSLQFSAFGLVPRARSARRLGRIEAHADSRKLSSASGQPGPAQQHTKQLWPVITSCIPPAECSIFANVMRCFNSLQSAGLVDILSRKEQKSLAHAHANWLYESAIPFWLSTPNREGIAHSKLVRMIRCQALLLLSQALT